MDLLTLDSNFQPVKLIENYDSLIWTERYSTAGDFQIVTSAVDWAVNSLPLETCLTLRESSVPMIIEAHKIEKPAGKAAQVTITGRSFETVLERRGSVNALPAAAKRVAWTIMAQKESDAAYMAMRTVLGDGAVLQNGSQILPATTSTLVPGSGVPAVSLLDAIPELSLTLPLDYYAVPAGGTAYDTTGATTYAAGALVTYVGALWQAVVSSKGVTPSMTATAQWKLLAQSYEIPPTGGLYTNILNLITTNHHGLKSVRPLPGGNKVAIEIYNGANLSGEGDTGDPNHVVEFDARFDQFDDATYLLSKQGSTNVAYVYGANGSEEILKTTAAEPSGLARRVVVVDDSTDTTVNSSDIRKSRGLIELYNNNETALFDGEISALIAAGYNRDYFLGDILKLQGEYGLSETVRVAEFIRSADSTGEKAYPTFEVVEDAASSS